MRRASWRVWAPAAALLAAAGVAALAYIGAWREEPIHADASDQSLVALGETVYAAHCAACHGAGLEGETKDWRRRKPDGTLPAPPHDESGHTWHHPDRFLFDYVKKGAAAVEMPGFRGAMPGFGGVLTDREIVAVLAYIKSRWPAPIRARQERLNQAYRNR